MKILAAIALAACVYPAVVTAAATDSPAPAFLFPDDEKVTTANLQSRIDKKTDIQNDGWLNQPLTRLDYALMSMENELKSSGPALVREYVTEFFDSPSRPSSFGDEPDASFSVRYSNENGRIMIRESVSVADRKPKKPLKDVCAALIESLEFNFPLKTVGFLWPNKLGILNRDTIGQNAAEGDVLARSAMLVASVSASYMGANGRGFYLISCTRQKDGAPIEFSKYSSSSQ